MAESKQLDKTPEGEAEPEGGKSRARWLFGWVVIPGVLLGALFLSGVHVGANHPDMWLARLITWVGN